MNLPAGTPVVQPPAQGDGLAFVLRDVFDVGWHDLQRFNVQRSKFMVQGS
jgi:hypothetical protein